MAENSTAKKNKHFDPKNLFFEIVIILTTMWMIVLGITVAVTMNYSIERQQKRNESFLMSTAGTLARSDMVHEAIRQGYCSESMMSYLDDLVESTSDLDIITITDQDGIRIYHVVRDRIGKRIIGGDEEPALQGKTYFSDAVGTLGPQHRAFTPVFDTDGETVLGLVMCSAKNDSLAAIKSEIEVKYLRIAILLLMVTLAIAGLFTITLNYTLRGYSPEWLVSSYFTQNELINSMEEGIIMADDKGTVQYSNRSAASMLDQSEDLLAGRSVDELIRRANGDSLLKESRGEVGTTRPNVLCRTGSKLKNGGYMLLLRDRTEAVRRAQQLAGTNHIITALRANTHEFMNKLQVIAGFLQMKQYDQANEYIGSIASVQSKAIAPVLERIHNANVAALMLGKLSNMRELEISMTLLPDTYLPEHSAYLSTTDLVTIIGNILENAIEAINVKQNDGSREIVAQIKEDVHGLIIMISDTGVGISPEDMPHIYETGYSTKSSSGRGIGMGLIQQITDRRRGVLEIDTEPGTGTTVTAIFSIPRDGARRQ